MKRYIAALSVCALIAASTPALAKGKDKKAMSAPAEKAAPAKTGDTDLKTALENRYWDMRAAIKSGDPNLYRKNMADDFVGIDLNDAKRDAGQVVAALGRSVPDDSRKEKTTIDSLKVDGDRAEVATTYDLKTIRKAVDGSAINYHMVTTSNDVWVKKDDQWLLQKTQAETGDVFINDKLVAHRVRGQKEATAPAATDAAKKSEEEKKAP
jgi:hypothetical protein